MKKHPALLRAGRLLKKKKASHKEGGGEKRGGMKAHEEGFIILLRISLVFSLTNYEIDQLGIRTGYWLFLLMTKKSSCRYFLAPMRAPDAVDASWASSLARLLDKGAMSDVICIPEEHVDVELPVREPLIVAIGILVLDGTVVGSIRSGILQDLRADIPVLQLNKEEITHAPAVTAALLDDAVVSLASVAVLDGLSLLTDKINDSINVGAGTHGGVNISGHGNRNNGQKSNDELHLQ